MVLAVYAAETAAFEKDRSAAVPSGYDRLLAVMEFYEVHHRLIRHPADASHAAGPVGSAASRAKFAVLKIVFHISAIVLLRFDMLVVISKRT